MGVSVVVMFGVEDVVMLWCCVVVLLWWCEEEEGIWRHDDSQSLLAPLASLKLHRKKAR